MKNVRWIALILTVLMTLGALASCAADDTVENESGSDSSVESVSDTQNEDESVNLDAEPVMLTVSDAKGSAGLVGDFMAIFSPETNGEQTVNGPANNSLPYQIYAVLSSPSVITGLVLTAPTENQALMGGATVDGSVDGINWVNLKVIGNTMTAGKTYTLNIGDETAYRYIRIRQSEARRTEAFIFRNMLINGIPTDGVAGSMSNIVDESDPSKLINISAYLAADTAQGDYTDVFKDNDNAWTAKASQTSLPDYLVATMTKKTEIRRITVKLSGSNRTVLGTVIQASENGAEWDDLYTFAEGDLAAAEAGGFTVSVSGDTKYSYIRILQNPDMLGQSWTLNTILIYGIESDEATSELPAKYVLATTVGATYEDSNTVARSAKDVPSSVWDLSVKNSVYTHEAQTSLTERKEFWISAELAGPTVITEITYYLPDSEHASRVRTSYFEASVDGVEWVRIATMPEGTPPYRNVTEITLTVDDDTEYSYIRIVQGETFYKEYWTLGSVEIKGICE